MSSVLGRASGLPLSSKLIEETPAVLAVWRHFGEPDRGFDRLDLAEEGTHTSKLVTPPVGEQPGRLRCHLPLTGVGQATPCFDVPAHLVNDRRDVILLLFGREALAFVEHEALLLVLGFVLLGLGNRRDERDRAAALKDFLGRLPVPVEFPMPGRPHVRRIQDRVVEEGIRHDRKPIHRCGTGP